MQTKPLLEALKKCNKTTGKYKCTCSRYDKYRIASFMQSCTCKVKRDNILKYAHVEVKQGKMTLTTCNLIEYTQVVIDCDLDDMIFLLPCKQTIDVLNTFTQEFDILVVNYEVTLINGNCKYRLLYIDPEKFPSIENCKQA